jgi:hypothetical protein
MQPAGSRGDYETDFEEISTQQTTTGKKNICTRHTEVEVFRSSRIVIVA